MLFRKEQEIEFERQDILGGFSEEIILERDDGGDIHDLIEEGEQGASC